jgi:hypothetical protein
MDYGAILDFLKSPGGSSLVGAGLKGIAGMGQARADERMFNQQAGMNMQQAVLGDLFNRDAMLAQQAPTGWGQNYQQQTLMKDLMLQKLMNGGGGLTPTNSAVAAKLQGISTPSKLTIPDEWKQVNPFGVDQTMQSLAQRQGVLDLLSGGRGPGMDFNAMGYDPTKAGVLNQQTNDYRKFAGDDYAQRIQTAGMPGQGQPPPEGMEYDEKTGELKKKGSSIWSKIGKGLLIGGAGLATAFTGGAASPLLMAAIGGGLGAAGGAMGGGGWKGALLGGGLGAIPGVGGMIGGNAGKAVQVGAGMIPGMPSSGGGIPIGPGRVSDVMQTPMAHHQNPYALTYGQPYGQSPINQQLLNAINMQVRR